MIKRLNVAEPSKCGAESNLNTFIPFSNSVRNQKKHTKKKREKLT